MKKHNGQLRSSGAALPLSDKRAAEIAEAFAPKTVAVTIFLADTAEGYALTREHIYREWDGTRREVFARVASAGTEGRIELAFVKDANETTWDLLERVFAAANGMPNLIDVDVRDSYYEHEVRSLSIGDLVNVPGEGVFAVARAGFTRTNVRIEVLS